MEVILRVYTLGTREAVQMLNTVLKKDFKGIWHTSIEVYGKEIFFANEIIKTIPDTTIHGLPHTKHNMGITNVSEEEFNLFLQTLEDQFGKNTYDLLRNNCNHFTDTCTSFLVDKKVPNYIMEVHEAALESEVVSKMMGIFFNKPN